MKCQIEKNQIFYQAEKPESQETLKYRKAHCQLTKLFQVWILMIIRDFIRTLSLRWAMGICQRIRVKTLFILEVTIVHNQENFKTICLDKIIHKVLYQEQMKV